MHLLFFNSTLIALYSHAKWKLSDVHKNIEHACAACISAYICGSYRKNGEYLLYLLRYIAAYGATLSPTQSFQEKLQLQCIVYEKDVTLVRRYRSGTSGVGATFMPRSGQHFTISTPFYNAKLDARNQMTVPNDSSPCLHILIQNISFLITIKVNANTTKSSNENY